MADFAFVRVERRGGCAWVTLDRPPLNLIVPEMVRGIKAAFEAKAFIATLHDAIHTVHEAPFPTVCMMNGHCLGGGFELAMACDMRTAAVEALMGLPEIRVGVPSVIEAALLPPLIGPARAAECLLTGDSISA